MKLLNDDVENYRTGVGLLAIHSAISLNDAITVGLTGKRKTYQDHARAARELERTCSSNRISDKKGVDHLKWLLAHKNDVAYQGEPLDDASVKMAVDKAQRFSAWAYNCSRRFSVAYRPVLSPEQQQGRAKNAVADLLFRQLIVPKIFFDAHWPSRRSRVDVLAVDRSGSGELHAAEVKRGRDLNTEVADLIARLSQIPAHFRYLALFDNPKNTRPRSEMLYSPDGIGRIGIIEVREDPLGNLDARISVQPERFKLDSSVYKMVDRFTASYPANREVRP
jgi:hypothetical protein